MQKQSLLMLFLYGYKRMNGASPLKTSCKKLWTMLIERDISKTAFHQETELSPRMMSKLNKGEEIVFSILLRICNYLNCDIGDICAAMSIEEE